ncbi:MAG TPA: tetratricopeptide repeat protein [Acidocella sp.]|nr:tetratricopeptide repeat protein [Acidocella sp.]
MADAAIAGGNPTIALQVSQSVLASDPHNLEALYHEAAAYYAVNRCEDALAAYRLALSQSPQSSAAQTGIGRCLLRRNAAEAQAAFTAAVQDDPQNAAALNDLGIALDLQGKFAAATQPYKQSLLVAPGTLSTEVNLGLSLALSGDSADALQYLGPLATSPQATPKIREDYAIALLAAGRHDEALQILDLDLSDTQATALLTAVARAL